MNKSIRKLTITALFVALVLLLGMTPIGIIPLGFINVTILCTPVIAGTIVLGLGHGIVLGICFGTVSMLSMLGLSLSGQSALAYALFTANPFLAILMCYIPRIMVPVVSHFLYRVLTRHNLRLGRRITAMSASSFAGSATNTILYLGLMYIFYLIAGLDAPAIIALITGTGLIAGTLEALAAAIIVPAVVSALRKVSKE